MAKAAHRARPDRESEDDELAFAYHAANEPAGAMTANARAAPMPRRAYAVYRRHHVERGIAMVLKAAGLTPNGRVNRVAAGLAWWGMQKRAARLAREAA